MTFLFGFAVGVPFGVIVGAMLVVHALTRVGGAEAQERLRRVSERVKGEQL